MSARHEASNPDNRVIEYIRVSTLREQMISPEIQHEHNLAAARRENLVIVDTVEDLDRSGRDFAKRKITDTIKRIEAGEAGGILTWKISRWGRNLLDSLLHVRDLQAVNGYLVSSTEPTGDINTPFGKFSLNQMLLIAELQSDQLRETWLDTQANRIKNGLPGDGRPRFGYVYNRESKPKRYEVDPITGLWLKRSYEAYVSGKPLSAIVQELNSAGIRSIGDKRAPNGSRFTYSAFIRILDSGFGAGKIIRNTRQYRPSDKKSDAPIEYFQGLHEPVISEQTWQAYLQRRLVHRAPRHVNPSHKFSALLICGTCNRKIYRIRDNKGIFNLTCRNSGVSSHHPCAHQASIRERILEPIVLKWLHENAQGEGAIHTALERASAAEKAHVDIAAIQKDIADRTKRKKNLVHMKAGNEITQEEYTTMRAHYDQEISLLKSAELQATSAIRNSSIPSVDLFQALIATWNTSEVAVLNESLRQVISKIIINPVGVGERIQIIPAWEESS